METELKKLDIVILQITEGGRWRCSHILTKSGFTEGFDYALVGTSHGIEGFMKEKGQQLLITGVISNSLTLKDLVDMIEAFKAKNPELVVITYSSIPDMVFARYPCFDKIVNKDKDTTGSRLLAAIDEFRSGRFRKQQQV